MTEFDLLNPCSTKTELGEAPVFSGGAGKGDDFRKAPDGFKNPSKDWAVQAKTVKAAHGDNCALSGGSCQSPAPSKTVTMPSYGTLKLGAQVPYKMLECSISALNVLNNGYNIYEYIMGWKTTLKKTARVIQVGLNGKLKISPALPESI